MRKIDYWAGVPLCWLLTLLRKILSYFIPKTALTSPKNILFIELSEMGSAILAYSMLEQAKKKYPEALTYFLIFKKNRESCEILGSIPPERVLEIDDSNFIAFCISTLKVLLQIRSLKIDTAIDMELFSRATAIITFCTGATRRIGFHRYTNEGLYRGSLLTHEVPYNPHQHISLNFLTLLAAIDADPKQIPLVKVNLESEKITLPLYKPSAIDTNFIEQLLKKEAPHLSENSELFIINPDPGDALPIRGWPMDRFISTTKTLLEDHPNAYAIVIGLKRSRSYAEALQKELGTERCLDFCGKTPDLKTLVTLMLRSKLLLTNDSGPAHLASLANLATVVLFGPETPALYGPLHEKCKSLFAHFSCSPCLTALNHRHTLCNDNLCLKAIGIDVVLLHARRLLQT